MKGASRLIATTACLLLLALPALSQEHPALERGLAAGKAYQIGDIDSVNLFNGGIGLRLGIGQTFNAGGTLSYGLVLTYNPQVWDFYRDEITMCYGCWSAEQCGPYAYDFPYTDARLRTDDNAGAGWRLGFGDLNGSHVGDVYTWSYTAPDGGGHTFYTTLHQGETPVSNVWYTRDGSYLRLARSAPSTFPGFDFDVDVELPDGTTHRFAGLFLVGGGISLELKLITDTFDNQVTFTRSGNVLTIADSTGRSHTVTSAGTYPGYVTEVRLASAYDDPNTPGPDPAVYTFHYAQASVCKSCKRTRLCEFFKDYPEIPVDQPKVTGTFLVGITLPDGSSYCMGSDCTNWASASPTTHYNIVTDCSADACDTIPKDKSATLKKIGLPTGGTMEWTYAAWVNPQGSSSCYQDGEWFQTVVAESMGVGSKTVSDPTGGSGGGTWTYSHDAPHLPSGEVDPAADYSWTDVLAPDGNVSRHYFDTHYCGLAGTGWAYGLPFKRLGDNANVSTEAYEGATVTPGARKRTTYLNYQSDVLDTSSWIKEQQSNRRVQWEKTVFHDDGGRWARTDYSSFDGFGHYRTATTSGNFDSGNSRATTTSYNPSHGEYNTSGFVPWDYPVPWVLGTFDYQEVTEPAGGSSARAEYCFWKDSFGNPINDRVLRQRTWAGGSRGQADSVAAFSYDADGNRTKEEYFGGDVNLLPTSHNVPLCNLVLTGATPDYAIQHTYSAGTLATSRYLDAANSPLTFYLVDRDIDASTGLVTKSRDSAGVETTFSYDAMGRELWAKSSSGPWIQSCYTAASGSSPVKADVYWRRNGETCEQTDGCKCNRSPDNTNIKYALNRQGFHLDGFGRLWREYQVRPDTQPSAMVGDPSSPDGVADWNVRSTLYNAMGWKTQVSEWQRNEPATIKATVFSGFDPFGRPGTITAPDATTVTLAYTGVRQTQRSVTIDGQTSTTTETYDRHGRLAAVAEPSGASGAQVTTAYTYDVGNRLSRVCANQSFNQQGVEQCGQTRRFTYDNRGFLQSETLPEVGTSGNGQISYAGRYDARGHAHWKHDGAHALAFDFDRAERLLRVSEADVNKLPTAVKLKEYTYATANAGTDLANGKLRTAWAKHLAPSGSPDPALSAEVQETYTYAGVGGAVSAKTTAVTVTGSTVANPVQTFSQAFTWTDLGLLASQSYPACTGAACAETPGRTVYTTYAAGFLTAVEPYYATAITYHPSGMTDKVTHARRIVSVEPGVVDWQSIATNEMARPAQIWTEGATLSGTGADGDWDTGVYAYDGAGNITAMGVQGFDYDTVSRLTAGTVTGFGSESYTYDAYGNLTANGTTTLTTDPATNRLDTATTGATYDAAGNLTSLGLTPNITTYTYDRFNQLASVAGPGINRSQATTADGERLFVRNGTTYLFTLRDLGGNVVREVEYTAAGGWRWKRDNVYRGGLLLASEARNEGIKHYHLDHLGSPRLVTNRTGEKYTLFATSPFGKDPTATQSGERMRFTVHERDLGQLTDVLDDIDYMHARSYSPRLGRFTGVDLLRGNPFTPRTMNRYAYVVGNPTRFFDPQGLMSNDKAVASVTVEGADPCPWAPAGMSCEEWEAKKQADAMSLRMRLALVHFKVSLLKEEVNSRIDSELENLNWVDSSDSHLMRLLSENRKPCSGSWRERFLKAFRDTNAVPGTLAPPLFSVGMAPVFAQELGWPTFGSLALQMAKGGGEAVVVEGVEMSGIEALGLARAVGPISFMGTGIAYEVGIVAGSAINAGIGPCDF